MGLYHVRGESKQCERHVRKKSMHVRVRVPVSGKLGGPARHGTSLAYNDVSEMRLRCWCWWSWTVVQCCSRWNVNHRQQSTQLCYVHHYLHVPFLFPRQDRQTDRQTYAMLNAFIVYMIQCSWRRQLHWIMYTMNALSIAYVCLSVCLSLPLIP